MTACDFFKTYTHDECNVAKILVKLVIARNPHSLLPFISRYLQKKLLLMLLLAGKKLICILLLSKREINFQFNNEIIRKDKTQDGANWLQVASWEKK